LSLGCVNAIAAAAAADDIVENALCRLLNWLRPTQEEEGEEDREEDDEEEEEIDDGNEGEGEGEQELALG
jgi:hypothetical protein